MIAWAEAAVANPVVAYAAIALLELRVMWNVWRYRDVTAGDTAYYFQMALKWAHGLHDDIVLAPLYTNFFGTVDAIVGNAPTAVLVHRLIIVFAATLLVLALMRRLLGPALGLLVAAWWALLPPDFNIEYEAHLFGFLPILIAAVVIARRPGRTALGAALALLALDAVLIRNEFAIATIIFAAALVVWEVRARRSEQVPVRVYLRTYGLPLALVLLLALGVYWRSTAQGHQMLEEFRLKHELNMCQVYAFNYQQRHPTTYHDNPFTDCQPLMQRTFGRPMPSLLQEFRANPGATMDYIGWNARLLVSGLQIALFGATATGDNPDYFPVHEHQGYTVPLSAIVVLVLGVGIALLLSERRFWRRVLAPHRWLGVFFVGIAVTALFVALTQRPRAEYIYGLTVGLLGLFGVCVSVILRRLEARRFVPVLACGAFAGMYLILHSYYHPGLRPLHDALHRLQPVERSLQQPGSILVTTGYNVEICSYLAASPTRQCTSPQWPELQAELAGGRTPREVLDAAHATVIYSDSRLPQYDGFRRLLHAARLSRDWRGVASGFGADGGWIVLLRAANGGPKPSTTTTTTGAPSALTNPSVDLANPNLLYSGIYPDGWLKKRAELTFAGGGPKYLVAHVFVLPLPASIGHQHVQLLVDGRVLADRDVPAGAVTLKVPVRASHRDRRIEFRWSHITPIGATDPRKATALLQSLALARPPTGLRRIPTDLANPDLVTSGILPDGWLQRRALVVLAGGGRTRLVVDAFVLPPGRKGQRQHLQVLVNGRRIADRDVQPGPLELTLPVAPARSERRVEFRWAWTTRIGAKDARHAAALLKFLALG